MSALHAAARAPLPDVRRITWDSLADAIALLGEHPLSDRAVHGVRKDLKRARAMLRLMRAGLGEREYHQRNAALRDAARHLSAARDSKVLLDTLSNLPLHGAAPDLRSRLRKEHALARSSLRAEMSSVKRARKILRTVRRELPEASEMRCDWRVLQNGLRRVYARARAALAQARLHPTAENLHELRKQTKYLWHQLQALTPARRRETPPLVAAAHRLSDVLGAEHDLATLRARTFEVPMRSATRARLLSQIDARSDRMLDQATTLASHLYRDPPAEFAARALRGSARCRVVRRASTSS